MKTDRRLPWEYQECKVVPVCTHSLPNWGKVTEPIDFGDGVVRNFWWRVDFPDGTWIHCKNKAAVRRHVDVVFVTHPWRWSPQFRRSDNLARCVL